MSDRFDEYSINRRIATDTFQLTVNELPVNLLDFALISNMRHKAYGVQIFGADDCTDTCCLNNLARESLWRILFNIQQYLISNKRVALGPTYFEETAYIDPLASTFFTRFGAISQTNVVEVFDFVQTITLSPFVALDVPITLNGTYYEVRFSKSKVLNPHKTIVRDSETYEQFAYQDLPGYPAIDGDNWVMPLGTSMVDSYVSDPSKQANLQDYEYMIVDAVNDATLDLSKLVAFHPDSQQILPFAKMPVRVVIGPTTYIRYTFYAWTLGRPEFTYERISLVKGEFYKLYDSLEIYERVEEEALPNLYIDQSSEGYACDISATDLDQEVSDLAWVKIVNSYAGIVRYDEIYNSSAEGEEAVYKVKYSGRPYGRRYKIKHYYKVDPNTDEFLLVLSPEEVRRAIVAKVAATIELESCGCKCAANDYISEMQKDYTTEYISPLSGSIAVNYKYGHRRGDMIFAEVLKRIAAKPRSVIT